MVTVVDSDIGTGGDYTTISAWEAATDNNLVSADEQHNGILINDLTEDGITFAGSTTDATRYRRLKSDTDAGYDIPSSTGRKWTKNNFTATSIQEEYFQLTQLWCLQNFSSASFYRHTQITTGGNNVLIDQCIIEMTSAGTSSSNEGITWFAGTTPTIRNTVIRGTGGANGIAIGMVGSVPSGTNFDNVLVYKSRVTGFNSGLVANYRNCVSAGAGSTNWAAGTYTGTTSNNASTGTDSPGSSPQNSLTIANEFVDGDNGDWDIKIATSTKLLDTGVDRSAAFTKDYRGTTITGTWDIGPYTATGVQILSPTGIASGESFGTAVLSVGAVTVSPSGIASAQAFGTPTVSKAFMVIDSDIGSGGDYTTIAAWEAATDNNLLNENEQHNGLLIESLTEGGTTFSGAITDATRFRRLTSDADGVGYDIPSATGRKWTRTSGSVSIQEANFQMTQLWIFANISSGSLIRTVQVTSSGTNNVLIDRCIVETGTGGTSTDNEGIGWINGNGLQVRRTVVRGTGGAHGIALGICGVMDATALIDNVIVYKVRVTGIEPGGTTSASFRNVAVLASGTADWSAVTYSGTVSNNASTDSSAPGSSPQTGAIAADEFVDGDAGDWDLDPATSTKLWDTGVSRSGAFTTDYRDVPFGSSWDIGAYAATFIRPTGIASSQSFGTATLSAGAVTVSPSGIASAEQFGTPRLTLTVVPSGIPSGESFGTATVIGSVTVSPTGIASAQAFGTATLTTGAVTVSPTGVASAEAFGTATLTTGAVTVSPTGIASAQAFGTATLTTGAVTVTPTGIASAEAFGTAQINLTVFPASVASGEAFGTATLTTGAVTVSPSGIASGEQFGSPVVSSGTFTLIPMGVASAEAFGTATLTTGVVTVSPTGIASGEQFGTATLVSVVAPVGIASAEAFGTATLTTGAVTVSPTGIASAEAFGTATLTTGAVTVSPTGVASTEAFGTALVSTDGVLVAPTGIASGEQFGTATLTTGAVTITPTGVPSAEQFGTAIISTGALTISPPGIPSEEDIGNPLVLLNPLLLPTGIPSEEAFGTATLTMGAAMIVPSGIPSAENFGVASISGGLLVGYRKAIRDALTERVLSSTFKTVLYQEQSPITLVITGDMMPRSIEANEVAADWAPESRYGRSYKLNRNRWEWLLILRFDQEVLLEEFEESFAEDPPCILRGDGRPRNIRLHLTRAAYNHPPRMDPANGTEVRYRVDVVLSPL